MNLNIKIFLLCPIPEDQKPINQYIRFKENSFFNLPTFPKSILKSKLKEFFLKIFFFLGIITLFFFSQDFLNTFETLFLTSLSFFFFSFFLIFFRWKEIATLFSTSRIFYEEASWYDGEIWEKPMALIKNDKLLERQKIKPIFKKINYSIFFLIFLY
jgi:hypothetical protein